MTTYVELPRALAADLRDLAIDLRAGGYTHTTLAMFQRNLRHFVPSALGATISLSRTDVVNDVPVVVNLVSRTVGSHEIRAVSRTFLGDMDPAVTGWVDFYAGEPDAFDGLAGPGPCTGAGPDHGRPPLPSGPVDPGVDGLQDFSTINHALGILINRGFTTPAARAELDRRAEVARTDVLGAARRVIASIW